MQDRPAARLDLFHKSLWLGFLLAAGTASAAAFQSHRRSLRQERVAVSPPEAADRKILTPEQAKRNHLFWSPSAGAIKLLQDERLFDSVFPGYGAARSDQDLWERYFREIFDQAVYSPRLTGVAAPSPQISTSWLGSLDIHRKYGADILIFGLSETFLAVSAGMLSEDLNGSGIARLRDRKILQCSKGTLSPRMLALSLESLQDGRPKAALSLWGYSLGNPHRNLHDELLERDMRAAYEEWRTGGFLSRLNRRLPAPSWESLLGPGLQQRSERRADPGASFPASVAQNPRLLEEHLSRSGLRFPIGVTEKECDLSEASRDADRAIARLLEISEKVLIFVPPTAPLNRADLPACYLPRFKAMLRSKANDRVLVRTEDWDSFGLGYQDYLHPAEHGRWIIDPNHVNESGAKKVSARVAQWVVKAI